MRNAPTPVSAKLLLDQALKQSSCGFLRGGQSRDRAKRNAKQDRGLLPAAGNDMALVRDDSFCLLPGILKGREKKKGWNYMYT